MREAGCEDKNESSAKPEEPGHCESETVDESLAKPVGAEADCFEEQIKPFFWAEHESSFSVCLNAGEYKAEVFRAREDADFEGNGYDWASFAAVFLEEQMPELSDTVELDPEADMFCAYSSDAGALKTFILAFKTVCEKEDVV